MNLLANASVTVEFSPLLVSSIVGLLVGLFVLYRAAKLVARQPRYGGLLLGLLLVAGVFGHSILKDLGHLDALLATIKKPGVYMTIALAIAMGIWAFGMLINGPDFFHEKCRRDRLLGLCSTPMFIVIVGALGAANEFMTGMPSTHFLTQLALGVATFVSFIYMFGHAFSPKS
jgi:hypothetical protein